MTNEEPCPLCNRTFENREPIIDFEFENTPSTREEAVVGSKEEDRLFDAYQILRFHGVPKDRLGPMAIAIEMLTIYDRERLNDYYENVVKEYHEPYEE